MISSPGIIVIRRATARLPRPPARPPSGSRRCRWHASATPAPRRGRRARERWRTAWTAVRRRRRVAGAWGLLARSDDGLVNGDELGAVRKGGFDLDLRDH